MRNERNREGGVRYFVSHCFGKARWKVHSSRQWRTIFITISCNCCAIFWKKREKEKKEDRLVGGDIVFFFLIRFRVDVDAN